MGLLDSMPYNPMFAGQFSNTAIRQLYNLQRMTRRLPGAPMPRASRGRGTTNPLTNQPDAVDYSQFTYNPEAHAAAEQMLSPYGLHPLDASQANPNALFPNTGFFGRHPKFTNALEAGLFGLTDPGTGDTVGENISNVLGGVLRSRQERQHLINNQFAQPFNQAVLFEQMKKEQLGNQELQTRMKLQNAQIAALQDKTPVTDDPLMFHYLAADKQNEIGVTKSGKIMKLPPSLDKTGSKLQTGVSKYIGEINSLGYDPNDMGPDEWKNVVTLFNKNTARRAGGNAAAVGDVHQTNPGQPNAPETPEMKTQRELYKQDMGKLDSPSTRQQIYTDLFAKRGFQLPLPTDEEIESEIKARKAKRTSQFNDVYNKLMPSQPTRPIVTSKDTGEIQ